MPSLPFMKFYPQNYLADVARLTLEAKGAWMQLICEMWLQPRRGRLTLSIGDGARLFGCSERTAKRVIDEIVSKGIADAEDVLEDAEKTLEDKKKTLICRRMVREFNAYASKSYRNRRYRDKQKKTPVRRADTKTLEDIKNKRVDGLAADADFKDQKPFKAEAEIVAANLREKILERDPEARVPERLELWAKDAELLLRIDRRPVGEVLAVIDWAQTKSDFWGPNIMSPRKLREKFDTLRGQMVRAGRRSGRDTVGAAPETGFKPWAEGETEEQYADRLNRELGPEHKAAFLKQRKSDKESAQLRAKPLRFGGQAAN